MIHQLGPVGRIGTARCPPAATFHCPSIRLTAAALSGMLKGAHAASDPHRQDGELAVAGQSLVTAMAALKAAGDVDLHTATGELMAMGD